MHYRGLKDILAAGVMGFLAIGAGSLALLIAIGLYHRSGPILAVKSLSDLFLSANWHPFQGEFGFLPFIMGTLWVTTVAMLLAVPFSLLTAIYLAEYAPKRIRVIINPVIDLLAGISPVVYGVWGVLIVVPVVKDYLMPFFSEALWFIPLFQSENPTGFSIVAGGLVLAVMILPVIISVTQEVIRSVPIGIREASLTLGATQWQTTRHVVLRKALPGVIAAIILGLSRAFGETMAVLMVVGNVAQVPKSIFDAAYPLPALIANNYGEMMSIPLYDSALLLAALILLGVTLFFNIIAWLILLGIERKMV